MVSMKSDGSISMASMSNGAMVSTSISSSG